MGESSRYRACCASSCSCHLHKRICASSGGRVLLSQARVKELVGVVLHVMAIATIYDLAAIRIVAVVGQSRMVHCCS